MDYFLLKQDMRYTDIPRLEPITQQIPVWKLPHLQPDDIREPLGLYMRSGEDTEFLDYMEEAVPLLSERMMKLWAMYNPAMAFRITVLLDRERMLQLPYYIPFPIVADVLHPDSEWNQDHSMLKQIVLDEAKLQQRRIFRIAGSARPEIVVRLDMAESMLRRDMTGIRLERLAVHAAPYR